MPSMSPLPRTSSNRTTPFTAAGRTSVLWRRYKTLGESPARDATLWADVGLTHDRWMQGVAQHDTQG